MHNRNFVVVLIAMTALVVTSALYWRFTAKTVAPDAESKPDDKGSQSGATSKNRLARPRTPGTAPVTEGAGAAEPRPEGVSQGEQEPTKLSSGEIEKFLQRNQRNADGLRTAFLAVRDTNYLKEAAANFPNDPKVQLSVLLQNAYPEERRKWLDAFKESSPGNSLANYLSAREYIYSGQLDEAIKELLEATHKPTFQDFTMDSIRALEELGRDAGLSPLEAQTAAMAEWAPEHMAELAQLKNLTQGVVDLQKQYLAAADASSVEQLSQMAMALAGRLNSGDESKFMINRLVGISIEALYLGQLPPDMRFDFLAGKAPNERIYELRQQSEEFKSLARDFQSVYPRLTDAERFTYSERARLYGEIDAMRWLQQFLAPRAP